MSVKKTTIRLITDHITIDGRTHAAGDLVEVDKYRRKALVEHGHAEDFAGPAGLAEPAKRQAKIERATKL